MTVYVKSKSKTAVLRCHTVGVRGGRGVLKKICKFALRNFGIVPEDSRQLCFHIKMINVKESWDDLAGL